MTREELRGGLLLTGTLRLREFITVNTAAAREARNTSNLAKKRAHTWRDAHGGRVTVTLDAIRERVSPGKPPRKIANNSTGGTQERHEPKISSFCVFHIQSRFNVLKLELAYNNSNNPSCFLRSEFDIPGFQNV